SFGTGRGADGRTRDLRFGGRRPRRAAGDRQRRDERHEAVSPAAIKNSTPPEKPSACEVASPHDAPPAPPLPRTQELPPPIRSYESSRPTDVCTDTGTNRPPSNPALKPVSSLATTRSPTACSLRSRNTPSLNPKTTSTAPAGISIIGLKAAGKGGF